MGVTYCHKPPRCGSRGKNAPARAPDTVHMGTKSSKIVGNSNYSNKKERFFI